MVWDMIDLIAFDDGYLFMAWRLERSGSPLGVALSLRPPGLYRA